MDQQDLGALARTIIDSNMYMVLGTADESGYRLYTTPLKAIQSFIGSRLRRSSTHETSQSDPK